MSHPSRVRGLKSLFLGVVLALLLVAPFTGAWIENRLNHCMIFANGSRTLHGCVD